MAYHPEGYTSSATSTGVISCDPFLPEPNLVHQFFAIDKTIPPPMSPITTERLNTVGMSKSRNSRIILIATNPRTIATAG